MNILHLSDLHFGTLANATNWYSQLADDLIHELNCSHLDALILSGDIANKSTPREYAAAEQFLRDLCREFQLGPKQVVIVPGNHDLNWSLAKRAFTPKRRGEYKGPLGEDGNPDKDHAIDKGEFVEVLNPKKYRQRFSHFAAFYEAMKGEPYPLEYEQQAVLYHFSEHNLLILGLNSAWQIDHHYRSRASIYPDALSNTLTQIRKNPDTFGGCLKFAVWHHPIDSPDDDRIADISFLQRLAQAGFCVAFHGHIHKAKASLFLYDMSIAGRSLNFVGAGTFGALTREWVPGYPLQYNLLVLEGDKLTVETRCRREPNGAWQPDAIWTQGPGQDPLPRYEIILPGAMYTALDSGETSPKTTVYTVHVEDTVKPWQEQKAVPVRRVLILAVCPKGAPRLRLDEEVREICSVLWKAQKVNFVVEVRWAVRVKDLNRALLQLEPQIIHFCGHGGRDGGILLEDEEGRPHPVSPEALKGLFDLFSDSLECVVECVFLNSCYSEIQANAMAPYAHYIVGTRDAIADKDAIVFSSSFYEALADGRPFDFCFKYAHNSVKMVGPTADFSPVLRESDRPFSMANRTTASLDHRYHDAAMRILFLAASPTDTRHLRLDEEIREIYSVLGFAIQQGEVVLQQRWGVRFEDLHQALLDFRPNVVHFSGHGTAQGLVFEDRTGGSHRVEMKPLVRLFELFADRIDCVLLNATYSGALAMEIARSVDFAIGVSESISDSEAIAFSAGFYRAVGAKSSFEEAYESGCVEMQQQRGVGSPLPVLYKKNSDSGSSDEAA